MWAARAPRRRRGPMWAVRAPRRRRGTRASSSRTSRGALVVCVRGWGGVYGDCPCTPQPAICVWAATYADGEDTLTPCVIL